MPVNITIPTAVMITCDGDQFPVGITLEPQNLSNQPGTRITRILKLALRKILNMETNKKDSSRILQRFLKQFCAQS